MLLLYNIELKKCFYALIIVLKKVVSKVLKSTDFTGVDGDFLEPKIKKLDVVRILKKLTVFPGVDGTVFLCQSLKV